MLKELESRKNKDFVVDLSVKNNAYAPVEGDSIHVDPNFQQPVRIQTAAGKVPGTTRRIIAHELGHAVFSVRDAGKNKMKNVIENENPVINELGEPSRTRY